MWVYVLKGHQWKVLPKGLQVGWCLNTKQNKKPSCVFDAPWSHMHFFLSCILQQLLAGSPDKLELGKAQDSVFPRDKHLDAHYSTPS